MHEEAPPAAPPAGLIGGDGRVIVAIPARDEENHIGACLEALAAQRDAPPFTTLLLLNNCRDGTRRVVEACAERLPLDLHLYDIELPDAECDAATARRLAMNGAALLAGSSGLILTTDADSRVSQDWVGATLREFAAGVDMVCGFITPDTADQPAFDAAAFMRGAMEFQYAMATAELIALVDPKPYDPWPNHLMETGASLAITGECYCALGGVPRVSPGEDRALAELARRHGRRIRHTLDAHVVTSSRIHGRARGGWSADLLARLTDPNGQCHELLEPARLTYLRAALRHAYTQARRNRGPSVWAARLGLDEALLGRWADAQPHEAWAELEAASPRLARRRLYAAELPAELDRLKALLERVKVGRSRQQSRQAALSA